MTEPMVLVAFHTVEGQSARIAQRIAAGLREGGASVDVREVDDDPSPDGYDAVVVGDSIHAVHHSRPLIRYLRDHASELADMPTALFQVSLTSARDDEEHRAAARGLVQELMDKTGFDPNLVGMFGGNLAYRQYGWLKKRVMRSIARREGGSNDMSEDHDYTDWEAVNRFAADVGALLVSRS